MQQAENIDQYVPDEEEHETRGDEGNRVKFAKLLKDQWEKLERKNFSTFEVRVLQALQTLGDSSADKLINKQKEELKIQQDEKKKGAKKDNKKQEKIQNNQQQVEPEKDKSKSYEICVGQELYLQVIRPKLVEFKYLPKLAQDEEEPVDPQEQQKKKKEKKGGKNAPKKEDLMRIELSKDKVLDQTTKLLTMMGVIQIHVDIKIRESEFLKVEQASKRIKSLKWLELKFAALIIYAEQLKQCHIHSKFRDEYAFELIYFLKNLYIKYTDKELYKGQSYIDENKFESLSEQVTKDLKRKLIDLHKIFGFSNRVLFNKYPKLVIDTDLNQAFTQTDIKPYQAQIDLMGVLEKCVKPSLIFLNTMVGTGKTVMSVAIAQYLQKLKDNSLHLANNDNMILQANIEQMQFLYCCPLDTVRTQVGSAAYERQLKFGIASMWRDPYAEKREDEQLGYQECPRIVNSWANRNEEFPTLIVADFKTTLELLKEKESRKTVIRWQGGGKKKYVKENPAKNGDQYILFIDEPTVDADFENAETTQILIEIMRRAPPITILSSATLPKPEKLLNFIKFFKKNYGDDISIPEIQATQFQIGCQVFSHDGRKFLPHYRAKSRDQLKAILDRLKLNPFMQRCYNANAYCELHDRMKLAGITDIKDFETFDLINQDIVQRESIALLERLLKESEQALLDVCTELRAVPDEEELQDGEEYEYEYVYEDEEEVTQQTQIQQKTLAGEKQIQIEEDDKMKFTAPYSKLTLNKLGGKMAHKFLGGCLITVVDPIETIRKNYSKLIKKCDKAQDYIKQYEKSLELLAKEIEKKEKEIDNEDMRSKAIQQLQESMKLSINFPDFLKINTLEHFKKFVTTDQFKLDQFRARKAFSLEGIKYNIDVPDDILLYLFAGIAAYTEKPSNLEQDYYEEVQKLASNGQLALIVSDDSMCYGVNYPLNHVIVTDPMAEQRSIGALFQLIGRAGRVGVSWVANAYLDNKTFDRLVDYLDGNEKEIYADKDEAINIEKLAIQKIQQIRELARQKKEAKQNK